MVTGQVLDEAAEALARPQTPAQRPHHARAELVVAHEGHPAVGPDRARRGLADVVQEGAEAERLAARQLIRARLVEDRADPRSQTLLELDQGREHLDRVAEHVEVMELALIDLVQVRELRNYGPQQPEPIGELESGQ